MTDQLDTPEMTKEDKDAMGDTLAKAISSLPSHMKDTLLASIREGVEAQPGGKARMDKMMVDAAIEGIGVQFTQGNYTPHQIYHVCLKLLDQLPGVYIDHTRNDITTIQLTGDITND